MLQDKCFELDSKGIIAEDHFTEGFYLEYGKKLLELYENKPLLKHVLAPLEKKIGIQGSWKLSPYVDQNLKRFGFDMNWLPVFYGKGKGWYSLPAGITFYEEKFGLFVPIVVYNESFLSGLNLFATAEGTCLHELIHAARANLQDRGDKTGSAFEEAISDYFSFNFIHDQHSPINLLKLKVKLHTMGMRLEEVAGGKGGYILGRLKEKDFIELADKGSAKQMKNFLKEKKGLRFKIIKEKLSL